MKKRQSINRIRAALVNTGSWPQIKRRLAALTDAELREAEESERLGARRVNMLRAIHAEKQRRAGRPAKMLRLRMEVSR